MAWIMEVKVPDLQTGKMGWEAIRPSRGTRYEYPTYREAYEMLRICYPEQSYGEEVRVREC
jgi:hypothetical protein